jgi:hypothetical protein
MARRIRLPAGIGSAVSAMKPDRETFLSDSARSGSPSLCR